MTVRSPLDPLRGIIPHDSHLKGQTKPALLELIQDLAMTVAKLRGQVAEFMEAAKEKKTPWVVIDAEKQELRCERCKATHPLEDGVNHRPIWFATAIMFGFTKWHEECSDEQPSA